MHVKHCECSTAKLISINKKWKWAPYSLFSVKSTEMTKWFLSFKVIQHLLQGQVIITQYFFADAIFNIGNCWHGASALTLRLLSCTNKETHWTEINFNINMDRIVLQVLLQNVLDDSQHHIDENLLVQQDVPLLSHPVASKSTVAGTPNPLEHIWGHVEGKGPFHSYKYVSINDRHQWRLLVTHYS